MKKIIVINVFILTIFFVFPCISLSQKYACCPSGAIAFSSLPSYDKFCVNMLTNNRDKIIELIKSEQIKILEPGTLVKIADEYKTVSTVTIEKSSKIWAIPKTYLDSSVCSEYKNDKIQEKQKE
jgi:hypothetical protein